MEMNGNNGLCTQTAPDPAEERRQAGRLRRVRIALLVIAVGFIVAGILNGSAEDVLIKAIHLCTECVGLG